MKFHFADSACRQRKEEAQAVRSFLVSNGWREVDSIRRADLVVVFTCAFSRGRVALALEQITKIKKKMKTGAVLVVGGCLPKTDEQSLRSVFDGKTIHPQDFSSLNDLKKIVRKFVGPFPPVLDPQFCPERRVRTNRRLQLSGILKFKISSVVREARQFGLLPVTNNLLRRVKEIELRKKKLIYVASGCRQACSYCAIRFAVGKLRSKPLDSILQEMKSELARGVKRFELVADSLGDYGADIGLSFGNLLEGILKLDGSFRVVINYLHPNAFLEHFELVVELCVARRITGIDIPIQSANERILRLMNRPTDVKKLRQCLLELKQFKGVRLSTSCIIGFPGETDQEFEDTVAFLKEVNFDSTHNHCYSDMPGTKASDLPEKIDKQTMRRRLNRLADAGIRLAFPYFSLEDWKKLPDQPTLSHT
jgi:tRNA A37 methylthiotransferase MiaB